MSKRARFESMYTVQEVAREFGTTEELIEQGIRLGIIFVSLVRGRRRIPSSEVECLRRELDRRHRG